MAIIFLVFLMSSKAGVIITKEDVHVAVLNINQLLLKAKRDELGDFKEQAETVQPRRKKWSMKPSYWGDIDKALEVSGRESCLVASLEYHANIDYYDCDLMISSQDVNSCNFVKRLGQCLLLKKCTIYFEVSELSIRGKERLLNLVRDLKKFLDSRVLVILAFKNRSVDVHLTKLAELNLSSDYRQYDTISTSESKKSKLCEPTNSTEIDFLNQPYHASVSSQDEEKRKGDVVESRKMDLDILNIQEDYSKLKAVLDSSRSTTNQMLTTLNSMSKRIDDLEKSNNVLKSQLEVEKNLNQQYHKAALERGKTSVSDNISNEVTGVTSPKLHCEDSCNQVVVPNTVAENVSRDIKHEIDRVEEKPGNFGPLQILLKVFSVLKYSLVFSDKKYHNDDFCCTVNVTEIDKGFENYKVSWNGKGRSKKNAKRAAFLKMLNALKSVN